MLNQEELRAYFAKDAFAVGAGVEIEEIKDGGAVCRVLAGDAHLNAEGVVQGGVLFTLADFAFALAANHRRPGTVTAGCDIHFLHPAKAGLLRAGATLQSEGGRLSVWQVQVRDEAGQVVASVTVTGYTTGGRGPKKEA